MAHDIATSIAQLDFASTDVPDMVGLRARYPEISFVFDRIEELREENERLDTESRKIEDDLRREYEKEVEASDRRIDELRQAILSIAELALDLSEAADSSEKYDIVSIINGIVKEQVG